MNLSCKKKSRHSPIWRGKPSHVGAWLVAATACILLAGCASIPRLDQAPALFADAAMDPIRWFTNKEKTPGIDLMYVTDRNPKERGGYGHGRSRSIAFGSCEVEIGKNLPWQELIEFSTLARRTVSLPLSIKTPVEMGRFSDTPILLSLSGGDLVESPLLTRNDDEAAKDFRAEVERRLELGGRKAAFVFVHGYNNSFEDAAYVLASIWHFLGRQGTAILYTWPGGVGGIRGYTHDRESGEFTNFHLKQFLKLLVSTPGLEEVHLIAHSRGTDVITTALREIFLEARAAGKDPREAFKIKNLVLCSPDMDMQVIAQRFMAEHALKAIGRTTVYVSQHDRAIAFARWLFKSARRLGQMRSTDLSEASSRNLALVGNLDIIDVTSRTDAIGHAYFHSNPSVSADLILLLREGRAPGQANGRPLIPILPGYWELPTGYPKNKVPEEATAKADAARERYFRDAEINPPPPPSEQPPPPSASALAPLPGEAPAADSRPPRPPGMPEGWPERTVLVE